MTNQIPPWGNNEGNPWGEFDLFSEWVKTKNLNYIDVDKTSVLVELWQLCHEVFKHGCPDEQKPDEFINDLDVIDDSWQTQT
jgi:hypothetical protein